MPARRKGRKRSRKTTRRRTTRRTSPLANLAKKASGINTRVHGLEAELKGIPKRFVKRKRKKSHRLGSLEEHYSDGGLGSGE